jgi:hypothetical protein
MVTPLYTLARRALAAHQEMTPRLIRIQSGFLAGKQIEEMQQHIHSLQETLCEMQKALDAPKQTFTPAKNFVPLK